MLLLQPPRRAALRGDPQYTDASTRVLTQNRRLRFREMEYTAPAENVAPRSGRLQRLIDERRWRISFPVEVRFACRRRPMAVDLERTRLRHIRRASRYWRENPTDYFEAAERIMPSMEGVRTGGRCTRWTPRSCVIGTRTSRTSPRCGSVSTPRGCSPTATRIAFWRSGTRPGGVIVAV